MRSGTLPVGPPSRILGGPGSGAVCLICGEPIKHDEMELEREFAGPDATAGPDKRHLHPICCVAWEVERARAGRSAS